MNNNYSQDYQEQFIGNANNRYVGDLYQAPINSNDRRVSLNN